MERYIAVTKEILEALLIKDNGSYAIWACQLR